MPQTYGGIVVRRKLVGCQKNCSVPKDPILSPAIRGNCEWAEAVDK